MSAVNTAAAALLRRNGEAAVPAGVPAPLRKTARHKLTGGILVVTIHGLPERRVICWTLRLTVGDVIKLEA